MYIEKAQTGPLSYEKMKSLLSVPSLEPEQGFKLRKPSLNKTVKNIQDGFGDVKRGTDVFLNLSVMQ